MSTLQLLVLSAAGLALFVVVTAVVGSALAMMEPPPDSAVGAQEDDDDPHTAFAGLPEPRWVWAAYLAVVAGAAAASAVWPMGWAA